MPLPKTMKGCMHKVKKEFPDGRSKKKMGKKAAHKQHVAMCLSATESFTFKDFLLAESAWPVTDAMIEKFWGYYESGMSDDEQRELANEEWSDEFTDDQTDDGTFDEFIDHAQEIYNEVHG